MSKNKAEIYLLIVVIIICTGVLYVGSKKETPNNNLVQEVKISENGIVDGINKIYDAVVTVENYKNGKMKSIGSGFIYSKDGYIMTNEHVITDAEKVKVKLTNGNEISATVVGKNVTTDVAVLKIDQKYVTKVASLSNSSNVKLGETVFTVGSPINTNYTGTITRGIISGKNRIVEISSTNDYLVNVLQTDASINPGNSGGPLCNLNGDVIGVNAIKIVENEVEGIGFAIPIEEAVLFGNKIIKNGKISKPYLGINMSNIESEAFFNKNGISLDKSIKEGVAVLKITEKGPAEAAGLKKGDVIVKINNDKITSTAQLTYQLLKYDAKETVVFEIIRGKEIKQVKLKLGEGE